MNLVSIIVQEKVSPGKYAVSNNFVFKREYLYDNLGINKNGVVYRKFKECIKEFDETVDWDQIDNYWEDPSGAAIVGIYDCETPSQYVNVYLHDRAYGGPWWYETYMPAFGVYVENLDHIPYVIETFEKWCENENASRHSDINSVLSEGRYEVHTETLPAYEKPTVKPHYE